MATNTTNYNLTKPDPTDFYDIGVTNANLDKIDTAIKTVENGVNAKTQVATTAEAQAGTNNTKVMTPLRVKEVADTKVSKTGDTMTGDLIISKGLANLKLQTPNNTKSFEIRLNANDANDYGLDFWRNGINYQKVLPDGNTQFRDTDGTYFSVQSLKQGLVDGLNNIAAAVTSKGVPTGSGANVSTIVNNINAIQTGGIVSGTVVSSNTQMSFNLLSTQAGNVSLYYVEVSLDFIPKMIHIFANVGTTVTTNSGIYNSLVPAPDAPDGYILSNATFSTTDSTVYNIRTNTGNAYVNSTGFRLPVLKSSTTFSYYAVR